MATITRDSVDTLGPGPGTIYGAHGCGSAPTAGETRPTHHGTWGPITLPKALFQPVTTDQSALTR